LRRASPHRHRSQRPLPHEQSFADREPGPGSACLRGAPSPGLHVCPTCGRVTDWRSLRPEPDGRRRIAVSGRLAGPDSVAHLPIDHFDGLDNFEDLPLDGRTVHNM
jgi:hypothetical protein